MKSFLVLSSAFALAALAPARARAQTDLMRAQAELSDLLKIFGMSRPPAGRPAAIPKMPDGAPEEGPEAALAFLRASRGDVVEPTAKGVSYVPSGEGMKYPHAFPVPINGLRNIVPMTPALWTPQQLSADFMRHRTPDQVGYIVFLKTEYCHQNKFRGCAVTTAVFEKRASPVIGNFRVYGAWVEYLNPDRKNIAGLEHWLNEVRDFYDFDQGPGANIFVYAPGRPRQQSDALRLGLSETEFETNHGHVPRLEAWLRSYLVPSK